MNAFWTWLLNIFFPKKKTIVPENVPEPAPLIPLAPDADPPLPEYLWNTPSEVRHSVRLICDEEGLTVKQKNDLCATVECESSGFNTKAVHENRSKTNGALLSTDWGLCQWNDLWHWKKAQDISPDDALNNPEKALRLMCKFWKLGLANSWVCYSAGLYLHLLDQGNTYGALVLRKEFYKNEIIPFEACKSAGKP